MAKIDIEDKIVEAIDEKHEQAQTYYSRKHLGPSSMGDPCDRHLWMTFRWAIKESFPGRILRLFRRGNNEEAQIVSDLKSIGIVIDSTGYDQSRVSFGGHVSGSLDGIISSGVPDAPSTKHVAEFKTHSLKSFNQVKKDGVQKSKHSHYVQMQMYMLGANVDRALYVAVCKDDDRIYTERLRLDKEFAQKYVDRAIRITLDDRMPPPISTDPSWFECKFCSGHDLCHGSKITKQVNCRTCAHSTATPEGTFICEKYSVTLTSEQQKTGCQAHIIHPDLIDAKYTPTEFGVIWHTKHGDVANGIADAHIYESSEIVANLEACAKGIDGEFRREFDSRVVG